MGSRDAAHEGSSSTLAGVHIARHAPTSSFPCQANTVVLLHGWLGTNADMMPVASSLRDIGYEVLVPDLPYHGKSVDPAPKTLPESAEKVTKALAHMLESTPENPCKVAVIGYSLGGRLALQMLYNMKSREAPVLDICAIILISAALPPGNSCEHQQRRDKGKRIAESLRRVPPTENDLRNWLAGTWYKGGMWGGLCEGDAFKAVLERRITGFSLQRRELWSRAAEYMAVYGPDEQIFGSLLSTPVLYVYGDKDEKYATVSANLQEHFERTTAISISNAGHSVINQQPIAVSAVIEKFLLAEYPVQSCSDTVTIESVMFINYTLPMKKIMIVNGKEVFRREGLIVALSSASGATGIGDISPLPGVHDSDVHSCKFELDQFAQRLRSKKIQFCLESFDFGLLDRITTDLSPVSRNGLQCALVHLLSKCASMDLVPFLRMKSSAHAIQGSHPSTVRINGVIPRLSGDENGQPATIKEKIVYSLKTDMCHVLKLKVGASRNVRREGEQVLSLVREVRASGRRIRLDANRSWSWDQFQIFLDALGEEASSIDFIEEPFCSFADLRTYLEMGHAQHALSVGLDESLPELKPQTVLKLAASPLCEALVLKPSVIGSLTKILALSGVRGCETVMSSAFESGVGLAWTSFLAAVCSKQDTCHGLGTYAYVDGDIHEPTFEKSCLQRSGTLVSLSACQNYLDDVARVVTSQGLNSCSQKPKF